MAPGSWIGALDIGAILRALGIESEDTGREALARCPNFHAHQRGDERPSWRIVTEPGDPAFATHHCHPCGFSGGILLLVSHLRGISWGEAAAWLGAPGHNGEPGAGDVPEGAEWIDWSDACQGTVIKTSGLDVPELEIPEGSVPIVLDRDWPDGQGRRG